MIYRYLHIIIVSLLIGLASTSISQNNVGIGTKKPDLTAVLHVADSNRGFMMPRTDTQAVMNYVNSLFPNPGIQHGLTIWETNMRTIYVYNGLKQKWEPVSSLTGPAGVTGVTGPKGLRGDRGIATQWRDSAFAPPIKRWPKPNKKPYYFETLGDTCGDFYHQTATGMIFTYDCIQHEWVGPVGRWRNFGIPLTAKVQGVGLLEEPMPLSSAGDTLSQLANLTYTVLVPPDTTAYIFVTTEGNVQKKHVSYHDINKMKFNYWVVDTAGVGGYVNSSQTVTIGRNIQIPFTTNSQFDKVPWEITHTFTVKGKASPAGNPLPHFDFVSSTIQVHYGQLFMSGNTTHPDSSRVIVLDNAGSVSNQLENFAVMNVYVVYERSTDAPYPY